MGKRESMRYGGHDFLENKMSATVKAAKPKVRIRRRRGRVAPRDLTAMSR
jgi:hypothetical protein